MALTNADGVIAGWQPGVPIAKDLTGTMVASRLYSLWARGGMPGPGAYDTTLNGVTLSSTSAMVDGQIPHTDPVSGNAYVGRFWASSTQVAPIFLLDRLWHNGGFTITSTSPQNITSPTWPARDANASTNGVGVVLAVEVSSATGAGTPTITVSYTNQAGTASRTGTNIQATGASSIAGTMYQIGLQAGDTGVRSVQSLTLSATWTSGTINLVAYRVLTVLDSVVAYAGMVVDPLTGGLPRLINGAVPYLALAPTTTTTSLTWGHYIEVHG